MQNVGKLGKSMGSEGAWEIDAERDDHRLDRFAPLHIFPRGF